MKADPTLFIIDSDSSLRETAREMLAGYAFKTRTFISLQEFFNHYTPDQPGCLLLDCSLPGISGLGCLSRRNDDSASVLIPAYAYGALLFALREAEEQIIVDKPFEQEDLLRQVEAVLKEDAEARNNRNRQIEFATLYDGLTARERQVLDRVVEGKSTKIIATELGSSYHTVRNQRSSILRKLQADTVVDAVRMVSECRSFEYYHKLMGLSTA